MATPSKPFDEHCHHSPFCLRCCQKVVSFFVQSSVTFRSLYGRAAFSRYISVVTSVYVCIITVTVFIFVGMWLQLTKCVFGIFVLARNYIQNAGVQYILDNVFDELQKDDSRRFIYVEVAFFSRWWREQHDIIRHRVKALVNAGWWWINEWCIQDT